MNILYEIQQQVSASRGHSETMFYIVTYIGRDQDGSHRSTRGSGVICNGNIHTGLLIIERNKAVLPSDASHMFRNHAINRVTMTTGDDTSYKYLKHVTSDVFYVQRMYWILQTWRHRELLGAPC